MYEYFVSFNYGSWFSNTIVPADQKIGKPDDIENLETWISIETGWAKVIVINFILLETEPK